MLWVSKIFRSQKRVDRVRFEPQLFPAKLNETELLRPLTDYIDYVHEREIAEKYSFDNTVKDIFQHYNVKISFDNWNAWNRSIRNKKIAVYLRDTEPNSGIAIWAVYLGSNPFFVTYHNDMITSALPFDQTFQKDLVAARRALILSQQNNARQA
jgi:hypothetical protein